MRRQIAILVVAVALSACAATPTLYQQATGPKAVGYTEYRIESDRYRVTFRGGRGASEQQVADYALLRAAELTISSGYDWFRVVERGTQVVGGSGPQLSIGTGGADYGHHSAVGVGVGTSFDLGGGPALAQTIEILLGKGPAPRGADIYIAREVDRAIRSRT